MQVWNRAVTEVEKLMQLLVPGILMVTENNMNFLCFDSI